MITDLEPDRSLYHVGMPERFALVTFSVTSLAHKDRIIEELSRKGFHLREVSGSIR
jgi:hypothetical protein